MKKTLLCVLVLTLVLSGIAALADYGAVLKNSAKVYAGASLELEIGKLPKYTAVKVKAKKSGKAEISWNGKTGWIRSKYLGSPWESLLKELEKHGEETTEMVGRYVKHTCYMYDYPSTKAHKIKKISKGKVLVGCGEKNGWSIVTDDKQSFFGYIKTSNLIGKSGGDGSFFELKDYPYFYGNML